MSAMDQSTSRLTRTAGVVLVGSVLVVAACDSPPAAPSAPESDGQRGLPGLSAHQQVAHFVSIALKDDDVRQDMLQAMRASLVAEHKLELREFLGSPAGARMRNLMSRTAGNAGTDLDGLLESLPPLDFYVPLAEDRKSWRGSDDVVVYSYLDDREGSLHGFRVRDGSRVEVTRDLESTFVALHPAKEKHLRINAQPSVPGEVIQDPDDGTLSGSVTVRVDGEVIYHSDLARLDAGEYRRARREAREIAGFSAAGVDGSGLDMGGTLAASVEEQSCDDTTAILECDISGGGGGPDVVLKSVGVTFCDNLIIGESNELEFRSTSSFGVDQTARVEGIPCGEPSDFPDQLSPKFTSTVLHSSLEFDTNIWETDGFGNSDDFAGGFNRDLARSRA